MTCGLAVRGIGLYRLVTERTRAGHGVSKPPLYPYTSTRASLVGYKITLSKFLKLFEIVVRGMLKNVCLEPYVYTCARQMGTCPVPTEAYIHPLHGRHGEL